MTRVAVIGAGPIGLEAAVLAHARGHEVSVFEQGQVGHALRQWGQVRLFSPAGMNLSPRLRSLLGPDAPPADALQTGPELADMLALAVERSPLASRIFPGHRVLAVGRQRMLRTDMPRHPVRFERPFRLLVAEGTRERVVEADIVLDASGLNGGPVPIGAGGVPAPGEGAASGRVLRSLGALDRALDALEGARVLLVGSGHSAAHAIGALAQRAARAPGTRVTWAVRTGNLRPCAEVPGDSLPERQAVVARANALAAAPPPFLTVARRALVERVAPGPGGGLEIALAGDQGGCFDFVIAMVGARPELGMLQPLALEISPVSEGAARLERALARVTDCLSVPSLGPDDLESGEPGFWLVGSKSYGRLRTFLLRNGVRQLEQILGT